MHRDLQSGFGRWGRGTEQAKRSTDNTRLKTNFVSMYISKDFDILHTNQDF